MSTRLVRNDALVPALTPPDHAYAIVDDRDRLMGVVAGSGRSWTAGRPGPVRSRPWVAMVSAETRTAAVALLVRGRP